ncbi:hypothetical protein [Marinoscillum luteum]|uniref:Secretion system C-terminal sorting domain-containing protein n=1 Tax=Marinoscillum luteum TaxID=861051 RepID=A0ABW7N7L8_9BACT
MLKFAFLLELFLITDHFPQESAELHITGVYQGKTLFIQNPYNRESMSFCVTAIYVNGTRLGLNYKVSALKLDFNGIDKFSPLSIKVQHAPGCKPIILNPDAIHFHSTFSFGEVGFADTALVWRTSGEKSGSVFTLEKYQFGIWIEGDTVPAKGEFGGAEYSYSPLLEEGANKLRIKYITPKGDYLLSREVDFHFYPEPVTFKPYNATNTLYLSRAASYEVFDAGGDLVLSGQGTTADISSLPSGDYVIYFDSKDPGVFRKD